MAVVVQLDGAVAEGRCSGGWPVELLPHTGNEEQVGLRTATDRPRRSRREHRRRHIESWARYETVAQSDDVENPVDVWTALVECVAVFELDDPDLAISEDPVEAFGLLMGMPVLHPYAREWTQTLTSHSQYPAFTLGLIDSPAEFDPGHVNEFPDRENPEPG